jgi:hypothetical protein
MQRDHEITELTVRHVIKLQEWIEIERALADVERQW